MIFSFGAFGSAPAFNDLGEKKNIFMLNYCKENHVFFLFSIDISAQIIKIQQVFFTHHYTKTISAASLLLISL